MSSTKMNPEVKALWLSALRSSRFAQARKHLLAVDNSTGQAYGHCCLAVLNELYIETHPGTKVYRTSGAFVEPDGAEYEDEDGNAHVEVHEEHAGLLPCVQAWAGLNDTTPMLGDYTAAEHNDGLRGDDTSPRKPIAPKTFLQIADLIEELL